MLGRLIEEIQVVAVAVVVVRVHREEHVPLVADVVGQQHMVVGSSAASPAAPVYSDNLCSNVHVLHKYGSGDSQPCPCLCLSCRTPCPWIWICLSAFLCLCPCCVVLFFHGLGLFQKLHHQGSSTILCPCLSPCLCVFSLCFRLGQPPQAVVHQDLLHGCCATVPELNLKSMTGRPCHNQAWSPGAGHLWCPLHWSAGGVPSTSPHCISRSLFV